MIEVTGFDFTAYLNQEKQSLLNIFVDTKLNVDLEKYAPHAKYFKGNFKTYKDVKFDYIFLDSLEKLEPLKICNQLTNNGTFSCIVKKDFVINLNVESSLYNHIAKYGFFHSLNDDTLLLVIQNFLKGRDKEFREYINYHVFRVFKIITNSSNFLKGLKNDDLYQLVIKEIEYQKNESFILIPTDYIHWYIGVLEGYYLNIGNSLYLEEQIRKFKNGKLF